MMKCTLLSLGSAFLALGIGVSSTRMFYIYHSCELSVPAVVYDVSSSSRNFKGLTQPRKCVVIVIASNNEFYIGKEKVSLSEIPDRVARLLASANPEELAVFIKGEPAVNYETLSLVIRRVKETNVDHIEIVPNTKRSAK
jgi:biopolymer transport protein ExbD